MFRLTQIMGACVLAGTFFLTISAHAGTYYVATTGSNNNPGTSTQPWKTITYAVFKMVPGDTTYVRGGTYNEGEIRFSKSGTQSAPIKLLSAPGEFPIIKFIDKNKYHRMLFKSTISSKSPIGWITLEGFQLQNGYEGIKIYNGHDLTIRRNSISKNFGNGVLGNGTRIFFDRNKISQNGSSSIYDHGIYMNGTGITVINNLIYGNKCYGIQVNGSASYNSASHAGSEFVNSKNWVVSNNTIAYNGCSGMVSWRSTPSLRAENNIFYENANAKSPSTAQGINFISPTGTGMVIRNNLAYASGSGAINFLGTSARQGTHYTQSANIVNTLKPAFVNAPATLPGSPNFALPSGSSAIDKGLVLSAAKIAYNGTSRPKGSSYDVGAYEYNGNTSQLLLAAPTSAQTN